MAEVFRVFSDKIEAKMASILERAIKDENDSLAAAIKRLQHNRIETERFGSNKSFYIGEGFARGRHDNTLDRMRKFYEREERIESSFARHFSMMSDRSGLRNANTSATRDETWMYQLGLKKSDVSSNFSYLSDQEKDQRDFDSKLEAARVRGIIEAHKKRQAGFDRGHNAKIRARLGQMHDAKALRYAMMDTDERNIRTLMDSHRSWNRGQAEQVYFQQLTENTKWLRFIAKDNPKIAKNLIPIAKAVGKASGLPFIGGLFANPTTAIMALGVGAIARTVSGADEANATIKKWKAYEGLYGNPTDKQKRMARLAGIKDVANISKVYGRLNVQRGDAESYLMDIGMAFRAMDERSAQLLAESEGLSPEEVRLAKLYAGEGASKADVVDANIEYLKEIQQRGFETGSGARATMRSLSLSIPYAKSAVARGMVEGDERFNEQLEKIKAKEWSKNRAWSVASNYRYDDPEKYQAMADAIKNTWDEVHDTAEIDDRYRAGMYDNSTTNNGGDKSVTVIQHINAEVKDSDPAGFVKEMTLLGGRGKHEAESVLQNNDSLRTN